MLRRPDPTSAMVKAFLDRGHPWMALAVAYRRYVLSALALLVPVVRWFI